jgi:hypothetical protein
MSGKTKPSKQELRDLIERVNSDPLYRLRFLVDPAQAFEEAGIELSAELKSAVKELVHEYVEKFPNIALLPTGLSRGSKRGGEVASAGTGGYGCDEEKIFVV